MPSGAVLEGRGRPLQPKSAGLPGITRQRVGLPLKIFRLNSLLLLLLPLPCVRPPPGLGARLGSLRAGGDKIWSRRRIFWTNLRCAQASN